MNKKETKERAAVVAEAHSWVGTPYHHKAKVKGAGVDCGQILIAVFANCGLIKDFDTGYYPPDWMMHKDEERYLGFIEQFAHEVESPQPGDLAIWRFGRLFSHGAIVIGWPQMIHAYNQDKMVTIADGTSGVFGDANRPVKFYSIWGEK